LSYKSRIPGIAAELTARVNALEQEVADRVVEGAKERVPVLTGRLRDEIHTEPDDASTGIFVVAGSREVFYGNIVEHGGAHSPPRPFLIPAAEQVKAEVESFGRSALRGL
jgi:HK97 gp10 family phage protein